MPLPLDEVFRRIAIAKGDVTATQSEREAALAWYRVFIDELTRSALDESPGDLSITHESMQATVEEAYREYRRCKEKAAIHRRLQDSG